MEEVVKNIVCYLQDDEDKWKGKIILTKEGSFEGLANNRITNSYITGRLKEDSIDFSLISKNYDTEIYSFVDNGSFNGIEYYDGMYVDYNGLNHGCYLTMEDSKEEVKTLRKEISDHKNKKAEFKPFFYIC